MPRKTDKRHRLIDAAQALMHKQGFNVTTLADIAQEADVPLGNVYYYFKTKEAIALAVIEKWSSDFAQLFLYLRDNSDPLLRLNAVIQLSSDELENIARFGCPVGGLCQELGKAGGALADQAAKLFNDLLMWSESQFKELGFIENAFAYALHFLSAIQGAYLLSHTFKDPKLIMIQFDHLRAWLVALTGRPLGSPSMTVGPVFNWNFAAKLLESSQSADTPQYHAAAEREEVLL